MNNQVKLRPWRKSDVSFFVNNATNPEIAKNMTDRFPQPYTERDAKTFIKNAIHTDPTSRFAILYQDEVVGSIGVFPQEDINRLNAELGYWLAEPFWGKGIMTDAIKYMVEYAFDMLPIDRIFARPFPTNPASQKILEKNGFVLEATIKDGLIKNGVKMDELIYAVRK